MADSVCVAKAGFTRLAVGLTVDGADKVAGTGSLGMTMFGITEGIGVVVSGALVAGIVVSANMWLVR